MNKRGSVGNRVSNNAVGKTVSDNTMGKSVANNTMSEAVSGNNSVSKTVSGQELGGGRGSSQQGGDASKGLKRRSCTKKILFGILPMLYLHDCLMLKRVDQLMLLPALGIALYE